MRKISSLGIVLGLALFFSFHGCHTNTHIGRWFTWRQSDVDDYQKFPRHAIRKAGLRTMTCLGDKPRGVLSPEVASAYA